MENKTSYYWILGLLAIVLVAYFVVFNKNAEASFELPCQPFPHCLIPTPEPSPSPSPSPTPSPTTSPSPSPVAMSEGSSGIDVGPSTQDTDCSNLDALTEEQALGDCGESKATPTPNIATLEVVEVVEEEPKEELEVFPSTGLNYF